ARRRAQGAGRGRQPRHRRGAEAQGRVNGLDQGNDRGPAVRVAHHRRRGVRFLTTETRRTQRRQKEKRASGPVGPSRTRFFLFVSLSVFSVSSVSLWLVPFEICQCPS